MMAGADEGEVVGDGRVFGEDLGNLDVWGLGADRLEGAPHLCGGIGLHVPEVDVTGTAEIEEEDAGLFVVAWEDGTGLLGGEVLGQGEAEGREGADLEEFAPLEVAGAAEGCGAVGEEVEHRRRRRRKKWSGLYSGKLARGGQA
jgi:hypothetical protein